MICSACGRLAKRIRRGLCDSCYGALLASGDRVHFQIRGVAGRRFILMVDMGGPLIPGRPELGPCWMWTGALSEDGYGSFRAGPEGIVPAHVWSHEHVHGPIPDGVPLDHICHEPQECEGGCGDPHRACTSPLHTVRSTPAENNARSNSITAVNAAKEWCDHGHPLSGDNLYIRPDHGTRECRACRAVARLRYDAARQVSSVTRTSKGQAAVAVQPVTVLAARRASPRGRNTSAGRT